MELLLNGSFLLTVPIAILLLARITSGECWWG